ncbi:unnamed protein product [Ilex paraguariensis]|uniref:CAND6/7 N-terminal domain-containing protein n=1 Tax=Ilex paraguariensis TaxID=185542 RepID=A0ABC8S2W2_9AQUA
MASFQIFSLLIFTFVLLITPTLSEILLTEIRSDDRPIIPFVEYEFTHSGHLDLDVTQILLENPTQNPNPDLSQIGFFLCTRDWLHFLEQLQEGEIQCPLQSKFVKLFFTLDKLQPSGDHFSTTVNVTDANQFTLVLANCIPNLKISMNVQYSSMYNENPQTDYLYAVKTPLLPILVLFFLVKRLYHFVVDGLEKEAAAEQLKHDDEVEL